jgi:DNA (cytosine-5)-methyltransferase 1
VFVVASAGGWASAAAVLFERESLRGDLAPRRQAREDIAGTLAGGARSGGGCSEDDIPHVSWPAEIAPTLNAHFGDKQGLENQHALAGGGFDASEDGTGRGTPLVPVYGFNARQDPDAWMDRCGPLDTDGSTQAIAIQERAVSENIDAGPQGKGWQENIGYTLEARHHVQAVQSAMQVRRLTPRECERLQGFADDYTLIPWRSGLAPDDPRYKALGNSMAVPVMRWIGRRIEMVNGHRRAA